MKQKRFVSMIGALTLITAYPETSDVKKNSEFSKTELAIEYIGSL